MLDSDHNLQVVLDKEQDVSQRKGGSGRNRMTTVLLVLIGTQILFTAGDFLARVNMQKLGFHVSTFLQPWFLGYLLVRETAMFGQLYIFTQVPLGKTSALFSVLSIILSSLLGFFFLRELFSPLAYVGMMLAITAILILSFK
jgi:drug/metabolite transporter (DMT)-like permease